MHRQHKRPFRNYFSLIIAYFGAFSLFLLSCSSPKTFTLNCQERHIEIYADDQYLGRDLVYYTPAKGQRYIEISCRDNGVEVYHKRINVESKKGTLIELQIPKNYRYSSKPY